MERARLDGFGEGGAQPRPRRVEISPRGIDLCGFACEMRQEQAFKGEDRIARGLDFSPSGVLLKALWVYQRVELEQSAQFSKCPHRDRQVASRDGCRVYVREAVGHKGSVFLKRARAAGSAAEQPVQLRQRCRSRCPAALELRPEAARTRRAY